MEITTLLQNPVNVATLIAVAILVVERLVTGGWLRLMVGKKTNEQELKRKDDEVSQSLLSRMRTLELHFNHETTEQYRTMIRAQEETLEILRRIERDGIRIKS